GTVFLNEVHRPGDQPAENSPVHRIRYVNGAVEAQWTTEQDDDPACCPNIDYSATFRWDGHKITTANVVGVTEVPTATAFVGDIPHGDTSAAVAIAAPGVAAQAASLARFYPHTFATAPTCMGKLGNIPDPVYALIDPGLGAHVDDTDRVCFMDAGPDG